MTTSRPIYLDYNATTPVDPRVLEEMLPYFTSHFGNAASRNHTYGWEAEEAVDIAREQIASLIGASPQEIVFTSGATEAANLAIKGVFESSIQQNKHLITVRTEHKAVLDSCAHVENLGGRLTVLDVDQNGLIDLDELENAIEEGTIMIAVMYANNETGIKQPIAEIGAIARKKGILFFTDATQAVGKVPVQVYDEDIDLLALSAHKLYGPKGIGALFVRKKNPLLTITAQIDGGGQERNLRSGTLNVPGIVGLGKACEICQDEMPAESKKLAALRKYFEEKLVAVNGVRINGHTVGRLPHTTNLTFSGINGEKMIFESSSELAFSKSSACTSATLQPSHVLKAMGMEDDEIHNTFRFSFGRFSTMEEADLAIGVITRIVNAHRHEGDFRYH